MSCCDYCANLSYAYVLVDRLSDEERLTRKRQKIVRVWVDVKELRELMMTDLSLSLQEVDKYINDLKIRNLVEMHSSSRGIRRTLSPVDVECTHIVEVAA